MPRRITKAAAAKRLSQAVTVYIGVLGKLPEKSDPEYEYRATFAEMVLLDGVKEANDIYRKAV